MSKILLVSTFLASALAANGPYSQCGGEGYTGDTTCPSGHRCTVIASWFSRCDPVYTFPSRTIPSPTTTTVTKTWSPPPLIKTTWSPVPTPYYQPLGGGCNGGDPWYRPCDPVLDCHPETNKCVTPIPGREKDRGEMCLYGDPLKRPCAYGLDCVPFNMKCEDYRVTGYRSRAVGETCGASDVLGRPCHDVPGFKCGKKDPAQKDTRCYE